MEKTSTLLTGRSEPYTAPQSRLVAEPVRLFGKWIGDLFLGLIAPFRRLRFKIGVAYYFSCLISTICVGAALIGAYTYVVCFSDLPLHFYAQTMNNAAFNASAFKSSSNAYDNGVNAQRMIDSTYAQDLYANILTFGMLATNSCVVVAADPTGKIVLQSLYGALDPTKPLTSQVSSDIAEQIQAVLHHGSPAPNVRENSYYVSGDAASFRSSTGAIVAIAPITSVSGSLSGVLYFGTSPLPPAPGVFFLLLLIVTIVAAVFSFIPAILFGAVHGGRLSGRLRKLSSSITAWPEGGFLAGAVVDRSGDEVGALARTINRLSSDLADHVTTRQRLATFEERTRVARNLHDTVKQQAFAAAMQLGAARTVLENSPESVGSTPAMVFVSNAEKLTNKVQQDLMAIIHDLKPEAMYASTTVPLGEAIKEAGTDWSRTNSIDIEMNVAGDVASSAEVRQELLRIFAEALSNVARHSRATAVTVTLDQVGGNDQPINMSVSDNGVGFDPVFGQRGLGLYSMRDRAATLNGGNFTIDTAIGKGVTIRVSCLPGETDKYA